MTRKNHAMIPVLAAAILIPQLLFWWLAPTTCQAHLVVYVAGSLLTAVLPLSCFLLYWNSDLGRTVGPAVVVAILQVTNMALSAVLLGTDATARTALFVFAIATLVCLMVLAPLFTSALRPRPVGVYPIDETEEPFIPEEDLFPVDPPTPTQPARRPMPARPTQPPRNSTPLPPRNH